MCVIYIYTHTHAYTHTHFMDEVTEVQRGTAMCQREAITATCSDIIPCWLCRQCGVLVICRSEQPILRPSSSI